MESGKEWTDVDIILRYEILNIIIYIYYSYIHIYTYIISEVRNIIDLRERT